MWVRALTRFFYVEIGFGITALEREVAFGIDEFVLLAVTEYVGLVSKCCHRKVVAMVRMFTLARDADGGHVIQGCQQRSICTNCW